MRSTGAALTATVLALGLTASALSAQAALTVTGQPYFGGLANITMQGPQAIGQQVIVAVGLNPLPLDAPLPSSKGAFYIGSLLSVVGLGPIPAGGILSLPFQMPAYNPALSGIRIVVQGYLAGSLTNPATIPLDVPYLEPGTMVRIESPMPQGGAQFGDRATVGDLNADGIPDLVVGAWEEDVSGIEAAGAVYVLWGPTNATFARLVSQSPHLNGNFGDSVNMVDIDRDGLDDLVVGESSGAPAPPGGSGKLHVYWADVAFSSSPAFDVVSAGTGDEYGDFGRRIAVGDFDDNGWQDIAAGNDLLTTGSLAQAGRIDVYWGPTYSTHTEIESPDAGAFAYFGTDLAAADLNGDGIDDIAEGSGRDDVGTTTNLGHVHLFLGPDLHWAKTIESPINAGFNTRFGQEVAAADLNGDGEAEVIASCDFAQIFVFKAPDFDLWFTIPKPPINALPPDMGTGFAEEDLEVVNLGIAGGLGIAVSDAEGVLQGCGLLGKEGRLYLALPPYYSTFLTLSEPDPHCGDGFGSPSWLGSATQGETMKGVTSAQYYDLSGKQNAGSVWISGF